MGDDLCWPDGYSWYYLKDHKILPTKRFYEKINTLFDKFIPEEGTGTTDPHQEGTGTPDPQNGAAGTGIPVLTSLAVCSVLCIIWWKWPYIRSWFCSKRLQQNPQVGPQPEDDHMSQPDSKQKTPGPKAQKSEAGDNAESEKGSANPKRSLGLGLILLIISACILSIAVAGLITYFIFFRKKEDGKRRIAGPKLRIRRGGLH